MDFRIRLLILLQISDAFSRRYRSSSEESIENLLYFKDCHHNSKTTTTTLAPEPVKLRAAQPECAFPKMCCSLTCGDTECNSQSAFLNQHLNDQSHIEPLKRQTSSQPAKLQLQNNQKRKKLKLPKRQQNLQPPIGGRRSAGFTKDRIMNLIHEDNDIRKILKDLVRVTMQKVDLVELINARRSLNVPEPEMTYSDEEYEDEEELE